METSRLLPAAVAGVAAVHVAGLAGGAVVPWTGTLAMVGFLMYAMSSPGPSAPRRLAGAGLAALSLAALCVEAAGDGHGWPGALPGTDRPWTVGALLLAGLAALAAAAWLRRAFAALAAVGLLVLLAGPLVYTWTQRPAETATPPEAFLQPGLRYDDPGQLQAEARRRMLRYGRDTEPAAVVLVIAARTQPPPPAPSFSFDSLSFDVWNARVSWAQLAATLPAALALTAVAAAVARRDDSALDDSAL